MLTFAILYGIVCFLWAFSIVSNNHRNNHYHEGGGMDNVLVIFAFLGHLIFCPVSMLVYLPKILK